jgi:hypothetical protein
MNGLRTVQAKRKQFLSPPNVCVDLCNKLGWFELTAINTWQHKACGGGGCDKCDSGSVTGMPMIGYPQFLDYRAQLDEMSALIMQKLCAGEHGNFQPKQLAIDSLVRWLRTRVRPPKRDKRDCPNCEGTGKVAGLFCRMCGGQGTVTK